MGDLRVREARGRLVREVWVEWAREQPDPKPPWLVGWDDLDDGQREVDMRIGDAVADAALAAVADHPGLADVLRGHCWLPMSWTCACDRYLLMDQPAHAAHLEAVVRAWLRGTP